MEDREIIELYWNRLEVAIEETDKKYNHFCKTIAFNILHSEEDTKECVNDTYFSVWNLIPPTWPDSFPAFLGKITRNLALKRYEYNSAQKRNADLLVSFSELEECILGRENVEKEYDAKELMAQIEVFLRGIDYEARNIFIRRYWYCDSISDIAKRFCVSVSKVKVSLFRTRTKLKKYLRENEFWV